MEPTHFTIEYHSDTDRFNADHKALVAHRLDKLARGHRDITGALVTVESTRPEAARRSFEVSIVLYHRPTNMAAHQKGSTIEGALSGALDAVTRQVRSQRAQLQQPWKHQA